MSDDIPEWALKITADHFNAAYLEMVPSHEGKRLWEPTDAASDFIFRLYARLIAKHEPEPVDPLLVMAREACAQTGRDNGWNPFWVDRVLSGGNDGHESLICALTALRMAKEQGLPSS